MKKNYLSKFYPQRTLSLLGLFLLMSSYLMAQTVSGIVTSKSGEKLPGVSVLVKGTTKGTATDSEGKFSIEAAKENSLIFSFVGFSTVERKVGDNTIINVSLTEDTKSLEEVVVTGLFDERKRLEASVSISTINSKQLERIVPNSSADLLRNIPGVFVNSSLGETRNTVTTRGLSTRAGYNFNTSGLNYVSMQEDGLPVTNLIFNYFTPDQFLRTDASLAKVEAVRGGTSSIVGANAPGGIFNYISKTGGDKFSGEIRAKIGSLGNGTSPYFRTDINFGGPVSNGWSYNLGGFYRKDNGPRNPGYAMNDGGQLRANLSKKYNKGSITFLVKYLNDKNGSAQNLIGSNFDNLELLNGVKNTDAYMLPAGDWPVYADKKQIGTFNPKNQAHVNDFSIGMNLKHALTDKIKVSNNIRYSIKGLNQNITTALNPITLNGFVSNAVVGLIGKGTITYYNNATNAPVATVEQNLPPAWTVLSNSLPNQNVINNGMIYGAANYVDSKVKELMDQLNFNFTLNNMSFNAGVFIANSQAPRFSAGVTGLGFMTLEHRPQMLGIKRVDFFTKQTVQMTSPEGYIKTGGLFGFHDFEFNKTTIAPFFAHNWQIAPKLNFDWGLRYEMVTNKGANYIRVANDGKDGGVDGNALTAYDNGYFKDPTTIDYSFKTKSLSFSGALNYRIDDNQAVYFRYSKGSKAPDQPFYEAIDSKAKLALTTKAQLESVNQFEVAYKLQSNKASLTITPFLSKVSNIFQPFLSLNEAGVLYNLTPYYNGISTKGLELETSIDLTKQFNIRALATFQNSKFDQYRISTAGPTNKPADDTFFDYSGNNADNIPNVMLSITPTYSTDKFFAFLAFNHTGDRWANAPNAFKLKGFSILDLGLGYNITKKLALNANINNLANTFGVFSWGAPGGFPAVFNTSDFSKTTLEANKNATIPIGGTPARSYFLTATYKF